MDQIVLDAIAKWPNVPACTGWLMLDRRGQWRMRDDACQAAGELGEPIRHAALRAFIERNFDKDATGRWFFQNGPQRVFVDLAYTPFVVRLDADARSSIDTPTLTDQCGRTFNPQAAWIDEHGNVLFSDALPTAPFILSSGVSSGTASDRLADPLSGDATDIAHANIALLHDHDLALFSELAALNDAQAAALFDSPPAPTLTELHQPVTTVRWLSGNPFPVALPVFRIDAASVALHFRFVPRPVL